MLRIFFGGAAVLLACLQPSLAEDTDDRTPLPLTAAEKAYVLGQMRLFVISIQVISASLADGNAMEAAEAAAARGAKRNADDPEFPKALGPKLPGPWKQFGNGLRRGFDTLSQGISAHEETRASLKQLGALMENCVACHASYHLVDAK